MFAWARVRRQATSPEPRGIGASLTSANTSTWVPGRRGFGLRTNSPPADTSSANSRSSREPSPTFLTRMGCMNGTRLPCAPAR